VKLVTCEELFVVTDWIWKVPLYDGVVAAAPAMVTNWNCWNFGDDCAVASVAFTVLVDAVTVALVSVGKAETVLGNWKVVGLVQVTDFVPEYWSGQVVLAQAPAMVTVAVVGNEV
jgi:hypothetical protein